MAASTTCVEAVRIAPAPSFAPGAHAGALHDHATTADESVVLDHHRSRLSGLEHSSDADAAGQVHVAADLGAGSDGGPGVDEGAGIDVPADVDVAWHADHARSEIRPEADDGARHRPDAVEAGLERHPVVVGEVAGARSRHRKGLEGQQDCALGPLVDDHDVVDQLGNPGIAAVELVEGRQDDGPCVLVLGSQPVAALPERVEGRTER